MNEEGVIVPMLVEKNVCDEHVKDAQKESCSARNSVADFVRKRIKVFEVIIETVPILLQVQVLSHITQLK
jgi:hypothetical protein